jgi:hypothetical protein
VGDKFDLLPLPFLSHRLTSLAFVVHAFDLRITLAGTQKHLKNSSSSAPTLSTVSAPPPLSRSNSLSSPSGASGEQRACCSITGRSSLPF